MNAVTQKDIALHLGLSRSTVKAALRPTPRVQLSPRTRRRVLDAARKMGYRVNRGAVAIRTGRSGLIGVLQFGAPVQFAAQRVAEVARVIHGCGYQPLVGQYTSHLKNPSAACDMMLDARVEGVVLVSPPPWFRRRETSRFRGFGIPAVAVAGVRLPGVPHVSADVRSGMQELTRHLLRLGRCRPVLLVQGMRRKQRPERSWQQSERLAGFCHALGGADGAACDILLTEGPAGSLKAPVHVGKAGRGGPAGRVVVYARPNDTGDDCETGLAAMRGFLKRPGAANAVLCPNDDWAMGALAACREAGLRVPADIAITGFDDMLYARYGAVPLTTVAQPIEQMATRAVELLLRIIGGERPPASEMGAKLPCRLVVRQSCGGGQAV